MYLQLHDAGHALFPLTKFYPNHLAALCSRSNVVDMAKNQSLIIWVF